MPEFHFHFSDGAARHPDEIGLELPDAEAAYLQAVASARSMGTDLMTAGVDPARCSFEITDARGTPLFSLAFTELFASRTQPEPVPDVATAPLVEALAKTHQRALVAKTGLAASLSQARANLAASRDLIARLSQYER